MAGTDLDSTDRPATAAAGCDGSTAGRCRAVRLAIGLALVSSLLGLLQPLVLRAAPAHGPVAVLPRFEPVGVGAIPRGVVATMAQDHSGFLWIATGDGLVRYDGYRFRPTERDSAVPAARNLGWIRALLPTRDGRLWIGTESDGLAVHDPVTGRVSRWDGTPGTPDDVGDRKPQATVTALAEDSGGAVWAGSMGGGLDRLEPATGRIKHHRHSSQPGSLPDDRVQALRMDRQGTLWVGTWQGLSRRTAGSDRFEPVFSTPEPGGPPNLAGRQVSALLLCTHGRLWVGTADGQLAIVDPISLQGRLLPCPSQPGQPGCARLGAVSSLVEAPDGVIWTGTDAGIDLFDARDGRWLQALRHDPRLHGVLAAGEVTTLLVDRAGSIWVAGFGFGLQRHNAQAQPFQVHGAERLAGLPWRGPLPAFDVRSLLQLDTGEIWAALQAAVVVRLDDDLQATGTVQLPPDPVTGKAPRIGAMAQAPDGSVWLGGNAVLHQVDRQRRLVRSLPQTSGNTLALTAARDGTLWVGTDDGLYRLPPGAAALQRVSQAGPGPEQGQTGGAALGGPIFAIAEADAGVLWVGSAKGLFRMVSGSRTLQAVSTSPGLGLGNLTVIGLLVDRERTLWVDTAVTGLHRLRRWNGPHAEFERVSESHGIVSRPFGVNLMQDRRGRIWTQLAVYDPGQDRLDELTVADGVNFGTGWFRAYAQTRDGRMLFGGSNGLLAVVPEGFDASAYAPPVVVNEWRVNGQRQLQRPPVQGLRIEPGQRSFSVEFAALDYSDPGRNLYAYTLEGFDPDWIRTGAEMRVASYSNLDPGRYLLRVRATNRSGVWSPDELRIAVEVLPAWWQTWWFKVLLAGFGVVSVLAVVQLRTRWMQGRRQVLERLVCDRTAELQAMTAALADASLTDPLTGLRNRRFLAEHIEGDVALALRRHEAHLRLGGPVPDDADLIFFVVDIDLFKQVNDRHGHAAGDAVLVQMRNRLLEVFRDSDHLVRWGGEEFLVVARDTARRHAPALAERACAAMRDRPFDLPDGTRLAKTCSIGFCCFPLASHHAKALDWSAAVQLADTALFAVKNAGRNGWLGLLSAQADSPEMLLTWAGRPLAHWWRSGGLSVANAPAQAAWAGAVDAEAEADTNRRSDPPAAALAAPPPV